MLLWVDGISSKSLFCQVEVILAVSTCITISVILIFVICSDTKFKHPHKNETELVGTNKSGYRRKLNRMQQKTSANTLKNKKVKSTEGECFSIIMILAVY